MKYSLIFGLIWCVISCKNPFSNDNPTQENADYAIENTENGKVLLRLKPKVGDKTNLQMEVNLQPKGMIVSLDTHFVGDLKLGVRDVDDVTNQYTVDFQRIQFETAVLGTKIKYDSQGDNNNIPQELQNELQRFLANQVRMELDSLARIQTIEFNHKTTDITSQSVDLNTLFIPLPIKPVQVGDSWTAEQKVEGLDTIEIVYTIKNISNTEVVVLLTTLEGEVNGQYLIDRQTGFTKKGHIEIEANNDGKGLSMQINLRSTTVE